VKLSEGNGWLSLQGPDSDVVLSCRARLARNVAGYPFVCKASPTQCVEVLSLAKRAVLDGRLDESMAWIELNDASPRDRRVLVERHLISTQLAEGDAPRGVAVSGNETLSVMVNEEDHLRLQSLVSGLRLQEAWTLVDRLDEELGQDLPYAYHHDFGFLTSCPTNVGTGLRASVLVHLPGLVLTKEIGKVLQGLSQVGLTFRGLYGEGSEVVGNFFQVSNQTTLGKTEEDLVDHLERMLLQVIQYENQARQVLLRDAAQVTEDKIWRAYGLLRYARSLSFEELMNLLSGVRLGVGLKLLSKPRVYTLNKIMIFTQSAHLDEAADRDLPPSENDAHRAAYVRRILANEGVVSPDEGALGEDSQSRSTE